MTRFFSSVTLFLVLFIAATELAYAQPPAPASTRKAAISSQQIAESGSLTDGVYRNKLLAFSMAIPEGWTLLSDEINKGIPGAGAELIKERQPAMDNKGLDQSISNTKVLFTGEVDQAGVTFIAGVETTPVAWTARKYAEFNRNTLLGTFPNATIEKDIYEKSFGPVVLTCFDLGHETGGEKLRQTYFVTVRNGVYLFFVATYWTDRQFKSMNQALSTLAFEK